MDTQLQDSLRTNDYIATGERTSVVEVVAEPAGVPSSDSGAAALFGADEAEKLRARWEKIQVEFVDEPRKSVEQADQLVGNVAQRLTEMFAEQKNRLEREWGKGEVSTEDLRTAFRRYRTLFDRLLSV
jgi:hypothetical protein